MISKISEKRFSTSKSNPILQKANEAFEKGLLENSAIYYQTYLNTNISKSEKILTLKKLFEISVLQENYNQALDYLDKIENLDKKNFEIPINRIKILIRTGQSQKALKEISKNQNKYKNSNEFKELVGIFYMTTNDYKKALGFFDKIPYNKREFSTHKKIIICYLSNDEYIQSLTYIDKIINKIKYLEQREYDQELVLLKSITEILMDKINESNDELKKLISVGDKYREMLVPLQLYSNIYLNRPEEIEKIFNSNSDYINRDQDLLTMASDFFYYNKKFELVINMYKNLEKIKPLSQEDIIILATSYFMMKNYSDANILFEKLMNNFNFKSPGLYKNLSLSNGKLNNFQDELFYLKEGMYNYPNDIDFNIRLAVVYINKNDWEKALDVIKQAKDILRRDKTIPYDNRLDSIYIAALKMTNSGMAEKELLFLRENESSNIDYYFSIIKYYIEQHKYIAAKRELESAEKLSVNQDQKIILLTYKMALAIYFNEQDNYRQIKNELLKLYRNNNVEKINLAITEIYENDFDKALNMLDSVNLEGLNTDINNKLLYLKALCYYYKNNFPVAIKLTQMVLDKDPNNKKINYLKSLINNKYRESQ